MHHPCSRDMKMTQYLEEEHLVSMTSRLKLNFRTTSCDGQSFPCFSKKSCGPELPCELQELILAYVPALKLSELKAVCRSWRVLVQTPRFKERWQLVRGGCSNEMLDVWVMNSMDGQDDLLAYIPALKKYSLFLPLICSPLVMTQPSIGTKLKETRFPVPKEMKFLCADGPWIVLAAENWQSGASFIVYGAHTCERRNVHGLLRDIQGEAIFFHVSPSSLPVLITDKDSRHFCLVVETQSVSGIGPQPDPRPNYQLRIYKSTLATWTSYSRSSAIEADFDDMSAVLCGDFFQFDDEDSTLYAWSMQHWSKVRVSFSDKSWLLHMFERGTNSTHKYEANAFKVMKCKGHILMITSMVQQERGAVVQCFIIWKLMKGGEEPVTWNWFEVSRTTPELCLKSFNKESFLHPTFMCDGGRICIMSSSHEYFPPLVYDVELGSWCHLHGVLKDMQAHFAMKMIFKIGEL